MNYEQHKTDILDSAFISHKMKSAVNSLDEMDCVKAMNYARTLYELMKKRVDEAQGVS